MFPLQKTVMKKKMQVIDWEKHVQNVSPTNNFYLQHIKKKHVKLNNKKIKDLNLNGQSV